MLRHITLGLKESSSGFIVASAVLAEEPQTLIDLPSFVCMEQGMEILLSLVSHEHPLPDVFDATLCFLRQRGASPSCALLWYELRLLHLLGFLPEQEEMTNGTPLSPLECAFLAHTLEGRLRATDSAELETLHGLCTRMLEDQLLRPLRSASFKATLGTAATESY